MNKMLVVAMLGVVIYPGSVAAADFHVVALLRDEYRCILLDPATIAMGKDGHKTARLADVGFGGVWTDSKVEFDCPGKRLLKLTDIVHLMHGETQDRSSDPIYAGVWEAAKKGGLQMQMLEAVCRWPKGKSKDFTIVFPDFEAAVDRMSFVMSDWWADDSGL